jgi:hypothetical protein
MPPLSKRLVEEGAAIIAFKVRGMHGLDAKSKIEGHCALSHVLFGLGLV